MISTPATKRLTRESFPDQADWIDPLLAAFNAQADALAAAVAQLNAQNATVEVDLDIPATYTAAFPKLVANPLGVKPTHVFATRVFERTDVSGTQTSSTRAVFVEWEPAASSDGQQKIRIKNVAGLEVSTNYRIVLKIEV